MNEYLIAGLALGNIVQFVFWSWQNQMLVNKLMCRDFAEYTMIKKGPAKKEKPIDDVYEEVQSEEVLRELNARFGS